jgi:hypothetical protein
VGVVWVFFLPSSSMLCTHVFVISPPIGAAIDWHNCVAPLVAGIRLKSTVAVAVASSTNPSTQ